MYAFNCSFYDIVYTPYWSGVVITMDTRTLSNDGFSLSNHCSLMILII